MSDATFDPRDALCTFLCSGLPPDAFMVARWEGTEAISQPYRFVVTLASDDGRIDVRTVIGRPATLAVRDGDERRPWHGIVTAMSDLGPAGEHFLYEAVLEPRFALLREFHGSETFLKKDLAGLLFEVLKRCGLQPDDLSAPPAQSPGWQADASRPLAGGIPSDATVCRFVIHDRQAFKGPERPFTCQFEETCLDFLSRHLERRGIYYWFEQREDHEVVVFGSRTEHQPDAIAAGTPVVWRPHGTLDAEAGVAPVTALHRRATNRRSRVTMDNFAASQAQADLEVSSEVPQADVPGGPLAVFGAHRVYGEHYDSHADGRRLAQMRAEAIACQADRFEGESRAPGLHAGGFATLSGHYHDAYNARYAILEVRHRGSQPLPGDDAVGEPTVEGNYANGFVAIPADVQFRPPPVTRKPRIIGLVSAIVSAEGEGQYAELDPNGCYRLRFPFAMNDSETSHNSGPVRMATPYAGGNYGMHLPLLKGAEVLVSFLGGDPDRPVIMAAVPNSENPNRLDNRHATQPGLVTPHGGALAFDDAEGRQRALLGSPIGDSRIAFGANTGSGQPGISMSTANHVDMKSTSYEQNVPGVYRKVVIPVGSTGTAPEAAEGSQASGSTTNTNATATNTDTNTNTNNNNNNNNTEGQSAKEKGWWSESAETAGDWEVKSEGKGGVVHEFFFGSKTDTSFGNSNDVFIGVATELKLAGALEFSAEKTKTFELAHMQWKTEEDTTIATVKRTYNQQTVKGVHKTENLVEYVGDLLGTYDLKAKVSYSLESALVKLQTPAGSRLSLDPQGVRLTSPQQVTIAASMQTLVGEDSTQTIVAGATLFVGDSGTQLLKLAGQTLAMQVGGAAQINADGALSLSSGLVRIG